LQSSACQAGPSRSPLMEMAASNRKTHHCFKNFF